MSGEKLREDFFSLMNAEIIGWKEVKNELAEGSTGGRVVVKDPGGCCNLILDWSKSIGNKELG